MTQPPCPECHGQRTVTGPDGFRRGCLTCAANAETDCPSCGGARPGDLAPSADYFDSYHLDPRD